jgi:hypothetical protein
VWDEIAGAAPYLRPTTRQLPAPLITSRYAANLLHLLTLTTFRFTLTPLPPSGKLGR